MLAPGSLQQGLLGKRRAKRTDASHPDYCSALGLKAAACVSASEHGDRKRRHFLPSLSNLPTEREALLLIKILPSQINRNCPGCAEALSQKRALEAVQAARVEQGQFCSSMEEHQRGAGLSPRGFPHSFAHSQPEKGQNRSLFASLWSRKFWRPMELGSAFCKPLRSEESERQGDFGEVLLCGFHCHLVGFRKLPVRCSCCAVTSMSPHSLQPTHLSFHLQQLQRIQCYQSVIKC